MGCSPTCRRYRRAALISAAVATSCVGAADLAVTIAGRSETVIDSALVKPHVLREYALLADGERGAVVGPRGDIAWLCAPRWHSPSVFSTLVGGVGAYAVTPREPLRLGRLLRTSAR